MQLLERQGSDRADRAELLPTSKRMGPGDFAQNPDQVALFSGRQRLECFVGDLLTDIFHPRDHGLAFGG